MKADAAGAGVGLSPIVGTGHLPSAHLEVALELGHMEEEYHQQRRTVGEDMKG